jgi:hypothetical protein
MKALEKPVWKRREERKSFVWISILLIAFAIPIAAVSIYALYSMIPSFAISSQQPVVSGNQIVVKAGADLQAAIDKANPGDTILLQSGAEFVGNFKLPNKSGDQFITIRTSAKDSELPPVNRRLDPKKYSSVLPKISSATVEPVIDAVNGAHHYRFIGVEFGGTKDGANNIIKLGTTEEKSIEELPHHIEFDRVYIHATSPLGQRRGIAANGKYVKILNSYIEGIRRKGDESQGIAIWATDGPVEIVNNYIEGAAENILFGGAGSNLKLIASDCLVRDNHLNKPLSWRNEGWVVKNLFEIKHGRRIKVENNLMTNNWAMGQEGTAVLFTVRGDNGGTADIIDDVMFVNNIVRGSGNAVNILGEEGSGGHNLSIINNIFDDIDQERWGGRGFFLLSNDWKGVTIENNTIIQKGSITIAYGKPVEKLVFRNNIVFQNDYGFFGDGVRLGKPTILKYFPNSILTNNVIVGGNAETYGSSNFFPQSIKQIGFTDLENRNYKFVPGSPYLTKGVGGKQIGANLNSDNVGGGKRD